MYLWIKHWWQFSHKVFIVKLSPWRYWLQRKWQQWNPTWNIIILNWILKSVIREGRGKLTSFVRQRGRPWWKPGPEHLYGNFSKREKYKREWDKLRTLQKGKSAKQENSNLPLANQNTITRKSPGKDAEDAFFDRNTATGFFDLWFSGDFVNAGFQLNLNLEGVFENSSTPFML